MVNNELIKDMTRCIHSLIQATVPAFS